MSTAHTVIVTEAVYTFQVGEILTVRQDSSNPLFVEVLKDGQPVATISKRYIRPTALN